MEWLCDSLKVQHQKFNVSIDQFDGCLCVGKTQVWTQKGYYCIGIISAVFLVVTLGNIIYFGREITIRPNTQTDNARPEKSIQLSGTSSQETPSGLE